MSRQIYESLTFSLSFTYSPNLVIKCPLKTTSWVGCKLVDGEDQNIFLAGPLLEGCKGCRGAIAPLDFEEDLSCTHQFWEFPLNHRHFVMIRRFAIYLSFYIRVLQLSWKCPYVSCKFWKLLLIFFLQILQNWKKKNFTLCLTTFDPHKVQKCLMP